MARRRKKNDDPTPVLLLLIPIGLALYGSHIPPVVWVLLVLALAGGAWLYWQRLVRRRRAFLATRDVKALSPCDFELWVAAVFDSLPGWTAHATPASNDQGADVIARGPDGRKYAVQVKHDTKAVGNSAVQEITAARAFYAADEAVVVTSGPGFTNAAVSLAHANKVQLWTMQELALLRDAGQRKQAPPKGLLPQR